MIEDVSGKDELLEQSENPTEAASQPDGSGGESAPEAQSPQKETSAENASAPESESADASESAEAESAPTGDSEDTTQSAAPAAQTQSAAEDGRDESEEVDATPVEEEYEGHAEPIELVQELVADEEIEFNWFILKVASNRENSIADALRRRVKVEGLDKYFGQIIVPVEEIAEFKGGKKRIVKRKLYPGYICVEMHVNDETWFVVRDTPGIGDFTGAAGKPTPMLVHEVERILPKKPGEEDDETKVKSVIKFKREDPVRIKEGTFENFEGDVEAIDEANGRVTVVINIFDRPTPVEIDHWQLESV